MTLDYALWLEGSDGSQGAGAVSDISPYEVRHRKHGVAGEKDLVTFDQGSNGVVGVTWEGGM
jgi:hypothetical protein